MKCVWPGLGRLLGFENEKLELSNMVCGLNVCLSPKFLC